VLAKPERGHRQPRLCLGKELLYPGSRFRMVDEVVKFIDDEVCGRTKDFIAHQVAADKPFL
jgi:hypothetical protein